MLVKYLSNYEIIQNNSPCNDSTIYVLYPKQQDRERVP